MPSPTFTTSVVQNVSSYCVRLYNILITASVASWVERLTIYPWLWSCCTGGSNTIHGTRVRVFPSNQATGKVFSTEYAIYCKFEIYLELVAMVKL